MMSSLNPQPMLHSLPVSSLFFNPSVEVLIEKCLQEDNCLATQSGAIVAYSGKYTGRIPKAKFVVRDDESENAIWWGNNLPMDPNQYRQLREKVSAYAALQPLIVIDTLAGADPAYQIKVRFILQRPYHALFIRDLLIRPSAEQLDDFLPDWTVIDMGKLALNGAEDGVPGDAGIVINFQEKEVLIAGTQYAGEIKKSVFSIMNRLLPEQGVLSMHCSANMSTDGSTALFFGLSGTGKTTLSADPERLLIGDDEHGWSDHGIFNIEGGCYAKCAGLKRETEPMIYDAIRTGALLENVRLDSAGVPDYGDTSITENTRAAYPIDFIPNAATPSVGGHPRQIFFLTCDALGLLPPISQLTAEQAMFHFSNGYTCKLAGTEMGVTEPELTFSTCFGQPFLPLPPAVYAKLLGEKIERHQVQVWLVNTGWTGGKFGTGHRIKLAHTRALLHAAFSGSLATSGLVEELHFGLKIPLVCPEVPSEILNPVLTWADADEYAKEAAALRAKFEHNFEKYS